MARLAAAEMWLGGAGRPITNYNAGFRGAFGRLSGSIFVRVADDADGTGTFR
jgi:hypothetical protein